MLAKRKYNYRFSITWEHWDPLQLDKAGETALKLESSPISATIFKLESVETFKQ